MYIKEEKGHRFPNVTLLFMNFDAPKAIGGSGVIFAFDIQMKVTITGVSTLFME